MKARPETMGEAPAGGGSLGGVRFASRLRNQRAVSRILRETSWAAAAGAGGRHARPAAILSAPQDAAHGTQGCVRHPASRRSLWFGLGVLLGVLCGIPAFSFAEEAKPDPAAHTVIVPYDVKQAPEASKADRFYLDYGDFQRLWALAKENRRPDKPVEEAGQPEASINSALYEAEVLEAGLRVKARLSVIARGGKWAKLALPFVNSASLSVSEAVLDGRPAALQEGALLIEEPGGHTVDVTLEMKLERAWKHAALTLPPTGAALLAVSVPDTDGRPLFADVTGGLVTEQQHEGRRTFTLPLGSASMLKLTRNPARRLMLDTMPAQAETRAELRVLPRMERLSAEVRFAFPGTERRSLTVGLDAGLRLESASAAPDGAVTLRKDGDKRFLDVNFAQGVAESAVVQLTAVRLTGPQAAAGAPRQSPLLRAAAQREGTTLEVIAGHDVQVKPAPAAGAERVESAAKAGTGMSAIGAWRLPTGTALAYTVAAPEDRSVAKVEVMHQLTAQKAEIIAALTLDTGRAPLLEARLELPPGHEVQTLNGPGVQSWHREGDALHVRFAQNGSRTAKLVVHLARTPAQATTAWTLEPVKLPQFAKLEGTVLIAAHAADEARLTFDAADRRMREVDPASASSVLTATAPMQVKRALRVEKPDWTAQVTLARQAPRFSVDAVLLAQAGDLGLRLSQQVGVKVEQGAVSAVKLRLPADLPEARVRGAAVRDAQSRLADTVREYDVTFQSEVLDRADFTLDLDLPLDGGKVLPVLQVDGAVRMQRFVIVDNAGAREMKLDPAGADSVVRGNIPWLPDGLARPQFFRAQDGTAVKLSLTQLESTAGNAAIVTLAEITTALRPDGGRWETVVYSLANRSLQFLPVRLPDGAELVEVSVGGQPVRADRAEIRNPKSEIRNTEFLVPLIQMRAGELSQQVRLVYRVPARGKGVETTHGLDDPELTGLSAERTLWNVWVPDGYDARKFDGNMDEVGEEGHELEKQRSLLSEVSRLNRVISSKEVDYGDAKMAFDNANKAIAQLRQQDSERKSKLGRDSYFKGREGKAVDVKQQMAVQEIEADVEKQIEEQGKLILSNSGNLAALGDQQAAQTKAGQGVVVLQGGNAYGNTWAFNETMPGNAGGKPALQGQTFFNDFVCVSNGFFDNAAQVLTKSGAGTMTILADDKPKADAPQIPQQIELTANVTTNNARGNFNVNAPVQQAQGGTSYPGSGSVVTTGGATLTLNGANTYTGATTLNAGTLTMNGGTTFGGVISGNTTLSGTTAGVQTQLQQGYSLLNLGDFDKAGLSFQGVLQVDPNNSAARRGLETAEAKKREYATTGGDHMRGRMLNQVNQGWENGIPASAAAPAARPAAPADPFASAIAGKPAEQPVALGTAATSVASYDIAAAPMTPQLKPVGRVSLTVEVPLSGSVFHFRKIKDHAALEVTVEKPLPPREKTALWTLLGGAVVFGGVKWLGKRRRAVDCAQPAAAVG